MEGLRGNCTWLRGVREEGREPRYRVLKCA